MSKIKKEDIESLEHKLFEIIDAKADGGSKGDNMTAAELTVALKFVAEKNLELDPEVEEDALEGLLNDADEEFLLQVHQGGIQ